MNPFSNRIWCHFCKRFVMDKLLRIHKTSIQHKENLEKCELPPYLFGIPRTPVQSKTNDTIEILSDSDTTIFISDDSRHDRKSKSDLSYPDINFLCSVDDRSSCYPQSTSRTSSASTDECGETDETATFCFRSKSSAEDSPLFSPLPYSPPPYSPPPYSEQDQVSKDINDDDTEYSISTVFPCGAWHFTQEFYDKCDWCNPKPGSSEERISNSLEKRTRLSGKNIL